MDALQQLSNRIIADGKITDDDVEIIRRELYADGSIDRGEVEFLIELRDQAHEACAAFEELFFLAVKENVLIDGVIDSEEVRWLRHMLFADGIIDTREKKFLRQLKSEAQRFSAEFQMLYDECMM